MSMLGFAALYNYDTYHDAGAVHGIILYIQRVKIFEMANEQRGAVIRRAFL